MSSGQCPVDHSRMSAEQLQQAAAMHRKAAEAAPSNNPNSSSSSSAAACPINPPAALACSSSSLSYPSSSVVGDNFPSDATPHPEQRAPLSKTPVASNIPRGGLDEKGQPFDRWIFPSPQRFYNAMKKKGWAPSEADMPAVVSIHNTVNEQCWKKILAYEAFHYDKCPTPKLTKFRALPDELSPKAKFLTAIGYLPPFDRHDWTVDRCGTEVRYILDFYEGKAQPGFPAAFHLDVRPEVSTQGIIDRTRMWIKERLG